VSASRKPRRWLQFSLASLLVIVTVVGLVLAPIVNRVQQQSRLVAKIEALSGQVTFDETQPPASWLRGWLDDDYFRTVRGVSLRSCGATDPLLAEMAEVESLTVNLEQLDLCDSQITDAGLLHIAEFRQLKALDIGFNPITNDGLTQLAPLDELLYLGLDVTEVTDDGLAALGKFPQLYRVSLYSDDITDRGAKSLATLPSLGELDLADTQVTNAGLAELAKMPSLIRLRLDQMKLGSGQELRISDAGLQHLAAMPGLIDVSLYNLAVTDAGVAELKAARPKLAVTR
jgi:internalin A